MNFSLGHRVQTGSGAHPASYPMGIGDLSLGVKRPRREADHSLPSSAEVKECVDLYLHFRNISSWRGAYLSAGTILPFTLCLKADTYAYSINIYILPASPGFCMLQMGIICPVS
jgi:hypothetical protein